MGEKTLDVRAMPCPMPVVETRKALLAGQSEPLRVLVADGDAAENVVRMARTLGFAAVVEAEADHACAVVVDKPVRARPQLVRTDPVPAAEPPAGAGLVILITATVIGNGDADLGRILMRSFLKTLLEAPTRPSALIFLHDGAHLTTEGSDVLADLARLSGAGVELLTCGTCLDYFHQKDKLRAGRVTDMLDIVSRLGSAEKVVRL